MTNRTETEEQTTLTIIIQRRWSRRPVLTPNQTAPAPYIAYIWNTYATLILGPGALTLVHFNEITFWVVIQPRPLARLRRLSPPV
jgi:hypothetical protein